MTKCSAPNCGNSLKKDNAEFSFHEFPEDPVLRKQWLSNIGRANWVPGRRSTICSVHFEETQIERLDQNIKLIKGAVPTIFSTTKRKRHSQNQRNNKVKIVLHSPVAEVLIEDAKHFKACPEKGQESQLLEFNIAEVSSLSSDSTNQADGLRLGANSENPISEVVLIDGSYVLEGCDFLQQESQMLNSNQSAENPILQETVKYVDGFQLEAGGELSDESCVLNENIICIEPSTTCSNLTADLTESSESKRNSVIIIEQSVDLSEEEHVLPNLSNIATPREKTNSFPADSESSALETPSFQINIKTDHSLQNKELDVSESERCSEMKRIHESTVQLSLSPSLSEGVIDLPLSMASHMHAVQNHSSDIRWQFGTFMCRLCGVARDKTLNLFSPEASQCRLLERISSVLHIKIVEKDDVPQSVCSVCLTKLDSCSELIVTSFHTHQHFVSVIDGDVKISSKLPFYCDYVEEKDPRLHCYKKHLLLMEIYHEEGKPINEYLTVACNDLLSRLDCKDLDRGSRCSLLLAPISDDCYVSEVEQARAAAEALIIKGITQNKRQSDVQDCKNMDNTSNSTESLSEESVRDLTLTEFLPPEESHGSFELHPLDYQVLSSVDKTDSCELKCFKPRCPKVANSWHTKNTVFNKMQKIFFWSELEDGQIKLVCRSCRKAFDKSFNFTKHIDNCSDQSMVVGSSLSNSIQENIDTSVEPKCPTKSDRNNGEKVWKSCGNKNSGCWYQCSFCSVRLQSKTILKEHLSQHHATKSTKCEGCGYKTLNVDEVTLRCEMCSQSNITTTWRCQMCVESFHSESKLKEHHAITGHCNDSSSWLCDVCGKSYSLATKLDEHKKSHLAPEFKYIHQCSQCPKRYINKSKLKEHMLRHEEKKFMCKVCGKLFGTKQILRQHEFTHGDPQYLCALCSRTFFRKSHLLKHMNVHNPDNPRTNRSGPQPHRDGLNRCRECKNVFGNDLLEHYKTCHPHIPLHHYICEICKQENTSYAELFQHQREAHKTGVKECPFCNKTIDGSTQMKYHLMKHEGMFPYNCSLCSNGYTANSLLQDHMRRKHTGEKPFQCQQCSKCFPSNGSLVQHSAVHTLPHQLLPCPVCNQGFKRKAHLDVHLRTHTGEKPYQCPICDRPFRQRPDCVKHIRIVHGEDPTKFKIRFHSNTSISFPQVVSVADMELVLEGEDLMQTSLESSHTTVCQ